MRLPAVNAHANDSGKNGHNDAITGKRLGPNNKNKSSDIWEMQESDQERKGKYLFKGEDKNLNIFND
jgi:hypothetical protein